MPNHLAKAGYGCTTAHHAAPKLTAHTHHVDGSSGSNCLNCHMPHTTYGVLKAIRSHEISSPKPPGDQLYFSNIRSGAINKIKEDLAAIAFAEKYLCLCFREKSAMFLPNHSTITSGSISLVYS